MTNNSELFLNMLEDDLLYAQFRVDYFDLDFARTSLKQRQEFVGNKKIKLLADLSLVKKVTKEARDFMGSEPAYEGIVAACLIVSSPLTAMFGNFYMRMAANVVPTKLVVSKEEGIKWLKDK